MTLGGLLDSFRIGAVHQKDQAMVIRSLDLSDPLPILWGGGVGKRLETESMINHAYVMKHP